MDDAGEWVVRRVVKPGLTRSQQWAQFAADVRSQPPGRFLDAGDVADDGKFRTADAAKSLAWRINHGRAAAFRPTGHYFARTEGTRVVVTYDPDRVYRRNPELHQEAS